MDILKRSLAPITDEAWSEIQGEAVRTLEANLSARKIVDISGPKGLDFGAVTVGRLDIPEEQPGEGLRFGLHRVLPLVEVRSIFEMDIWELDNYSRGARDLDLDPVTQAARKLALFEEEAIYSGFEPAGIQGLAQASPHQPIPLGSDAARYPEIVAGAVVALRNANVGGPLAFAIGPEPYRLLEAECMGYPASKRIENLIDGPIVFAPSIDGAFLISRRGGDLELILGQDVALGYETRDPRKVRLFLSESFTFRALNGAAVVRFDF